MSVPHIVKPALKWVGGKTQLLDKLMVKFPTNIHNYHEPFLGGGSVLLAFLTYVKHGMIQMNGRVYACDINEPLIYVYKNIQSNHTALYEQLQQLITEFNNCRNSGVINRTPADIDEATMETENYYYWIRMKYNKLSMDEKKSTLGSAMFIFLNKTCFRGVFRVGPNGFNVPFGHYNSPEIINKSHLDEIHNLIQPVEFDCCDFNVSLSRVEQHDFVYIDPPYAPETKTSFVKYTEHGFSMESHVQLFNLIHSLSCSIMLSNSDVQLVRDYFNNEKYHIERMVCKRSINSKNPNAKTMEVVITRNSLRECCGAKG